MPGLVSDVVEPGVLDAGRLVHTFLQVTLQVWQPMHLSRFSTMPICARTFCDAPCLIGRFRVLALALVGGGEVVVGGRVQPVDLAILRTTTNSSRLVPMVP